MAKGAKTKYTDKQKRQARHIEIGYERKGITQREAVSRAWATVNKTHGGGNRPGGSGYGNSRRKLAAKKSRRKNRTAAMSSGRQRKTSSQTAAPKDLKKRSLKTTKTWRLKGAR